MSQICKHYRGQHLGVTSCHAGVIYDSVKDASRHSLNRWPCFNPDLECDKREYFTEAEEVERHAVMQAAISHYFTSLSNRTCPHCGVYIEQYQQIGLCVYAAPCNHRLYQGTVPKGKRS